MRVRRFVIGLSLVGLLLGGMATSAHAAAPKVVPNKQDIQRLIRDLKVQPPGVAAPTINPDNPNIPPLPFVAIPPGLNPALGVLSPASFVVCQASYLGPLAGVVALTVVIDELPPGKTNIQPSFLGPLFGPVTTACVLAPFPRFTQCKGDAAVLKALAARPDAEIPVPGGLPTVDPFEFVPAPYATLVVEVDALQKAISYYGLNRQPVPGDPTSRLAKQFACK